MDPLSFVPDEVKSRLYDGLVDRAARVAESLMGRRAADGLRRLRASPTFVSDLDEAVDRAMNAVRESTPYPAVLEDFVGRRSVWSSEEVRSALEELLSNPGRSRPAEMRRLQLRFAETIKEFDGDSRYVEVLSDLLRAIVDELWTHPQLAPIYLLHMQRVSVEQAALLLEEVRGLREDNRGSARALRLGDSRQVGIDGTENHSQSDLEAGPIPSALPRSGQDQDDDSLRSTCAILISQTDKSRPKHTELPKMSIPCLTLAIGEREVDAPDAENASYSFIETIQSGVLLVFGEFGSGKSYLLRNLANRLLVDLDTIPVLVEFADISVGMLEKSVREALLDRLALASTRASEEARSLLSDNPSSVVVMVDAFDELPSLLGAGANVPSLESLIEVAQLGVRMVIAVRRPPTQADTSLDVARVHQAGIGDALAVYLRSCDLSEVQRCVEAVVSPTAAVVNLLSAASSVFIRQFLRPLFVQMLVELPENVLPQVDDLSVADLYSLYLEVAVGRDRVPASLIPGEVKKKILRAAAWKMFDAQARRSEARLLYEDLRQCVLVEVAQDTENLWTRNGANAVQPNWTGDFVRTNNLLNFAGSPTRGRISSLRFSHQSFFEYLLTECLVAEFQLNGRFGLEDRVHSVRAFDSLIPYFLRAALPWKEYRTELRALGMSGQTSYLDKLLALYLMEDDEEISSVLRATGTGYLLFLAQAEWTLDSYYMRKVVRYQLILLDEGVGRALAYVSDARKMEGPEDRDVEYMSYQAREGASTMFLERLGRRDLYNAHPIHVYRLGQFGGSDALSPLRALLEDESDPSYRAIIAEAIKCVESRTL